MMNGTGKHTPTTPSPVIRQLLQALQERDVDGLARHAAPDFHGYSNSAAQAVSGQAELRQRLQRSLVAFPDWSLTLESILPDPELAATGTTGGLTLMWRASGTHLGEFMRIPPTGRQISVTGITVLALRNGQISESQTVWDVAGWLRAVGLLPRLS